MKLETIREHLVEAVSRAQYAAGRNPTLPVLAGVLLEAKGSTLTLYTTNLDLGISISLSVKVLEEGKVVVPAHILNALLNSLASEKSITLTSDGQTLVVKTKSAESTIKTLPVEEFPIIPALQENDSFSLAAKDFVQGIKAVSYAASVGSIKPELSSIYIHHQGEYLVFAATDSFRLAEKKIKVKHPPHFNKILIPQKNATEIARVFDQINSDITLSIEENQIAFRSVNIYVTSRTIDGNFPDYKQIIPKEFLAKVILLKQDLVSSLKTTIIFSDAYNQLKFHVAPEKKLFQIESKNQNIGENIQAIPAALEGKPLSLSVNHRYFTDCFPSIASDSLSIAFVGDGRPIVVEGVGDRSFMYLVMPMNR